MEFSIPLSPITKKNSQRIVRSGSRVLILPSKAYTDYEQDASLFLPRLDKPIDSPVNVACIFYMPTRRRVDLTNLLEAIDDVLVNGCVLSDDCSRIIVGHDGSRVRYDKDNPRTEITITEVHDDDY